MSKPRRITRWVFIAVMFAGGALFQTTACQSANELGAELTTSWATSIANNLITSWVNQRFRVPSFNLAGLGT